MEWLNQIEFWHWLIAAAVMIIIEMILPAAYFLWMGISAFVVGLSIYVVPEMPVLIQVIIFGLLSVLCLVLYKRHKKSNPNVNDQPNLNKRGQQYVGRSFTLEEAIVNGVGKIKVDDSTWRVKGSDMSVGMNVRVMSVEGTIFNVKKETTVNE
ncbi:NfeD family protein [Gammaproteobacteria bacterium]|jgi:inner membrane protein|nr:NfeD family protein [Gammaproteobacteria bacterium]